MVGMAGIVVRNIDAMPKRHKQEEKEKAFEERIADAVTRFTGSMLFNYIHLALFAIWIKPSEPSFAVLAMIAFVEAIFLSTYVLTS